MKITKIFLKNVLEDTLNEYRKNIMEIPMPVELAFVDKDYFLKDAEANPHHQLLIKAGIIKDFEKEYPNFLVVYNYDKDPARLLLGLPFKISICYEIARERLKPYRPQEVKAFLKHAFAHEISHLLEEKLAKEHEAMYANFLKTCNGMESLANEMLAEFTADKVGSYKVAKEVENHMWFTINQRIKRAEQWSGRR